MNLPRITFPKGIAYPKGTIIRASVLARVNHWIVAICFVALTISGLALFHPLLFWLTTLFGSGQWTRAVHPWFGIVLFFSYIGLIVQFWRDNLPSWADLGWMAKIAHIAVNDEEGVPEVARFNAGQKMVFWGMTCLVPTLLVTGLIVWEVYFGSATSIEVQRIAILVHSLCALGAILLWMVHVYAATWVNGSMRAMLHGYVTPGWAWRHHRIWFRRLVASQSRGPLPGSNHDLGK
jgi:formate dehydrogenase subunit gamma